MKKVLLLFICILLVSGCSLGSNKVTIKGKTVDTSQMIHKHCTRNGDAGEGIETSLNYDIYYTGENLNIVKSEEKVISKNQESLDQYEEAYNKIHSYYEGLDNYETKVVRESDSVSSTITINYDKVDIDKLISIEGEKDNIFENKVPKVEKWLELAKKLGAKCKIVEEDA